MRKKYAESIGFVVMEFQKLEFVIKQILFSWITGLDITISRVIIADMSFNNMINLLNDISLINNKDNIELLEKIKKFVDMAYNANKKRNEIVHSYWVPKSEIEKPFTRFRMRKKIDNALRSERIDFTIKEIQQVTKEINETCDYLLLDILPLFKNNL